MDPNTGFPAGFPVPTHSPQNQQMHFHPNSMPQYPQQRPPSAQQQHLLGTMPLQPGPGGSMMPSAFPQQSTPLDNFSAPFTQAPIPASMNQYSQSQGTTAPNTPSTVAQTFSQNMASISANNLLANQPTPQQLTASPPSGPQPKSPAQAQAQATAREKARVTTLLNINSALLEEVVNLQAAGKAAAVPSQDANTSPTAEQATDPPKGTAQKPSQEYIECMRRLQANLAYLASIADRAKKSSGLGLTAPAIMTPPPNLPGVNELYSKLNELFPRAGKGASGTPQAKSPQTTQGNGQPSESAA